MAAMTVLVIVGTDFHPFDRLVAWMDDWLEHRPVPTRAVVQHGSSAPPVRAEGRALIPHEEVQELMRAATVVVTHGGPATIMEARALGKKPVVVPRDPALGEHVDSHQQRFARRLSDQQLIHLCDSRSGLERALNAAAADPSAYLLDQPGGDGANGDQRSVNEAVRRTGQIIDALVAEKRRRQGKRGHR